MINAAIIGVSGFGQIHYDDLIRSQKLGKVRIVGATVINRNEEREKCETLIKLGCRIYTDYLEMFRDLEGKIDLCLIPTGISMHAPMAIAAMRHGANCLIEKPAAACFQDVLAMQQIELETGKFVAVGFASLYQFDVRRIKEEILSGKIGRLRSAKGIGLWPRDSSYYQRNNWAGRQKHKDAWVLDSPFCNALAHYLNLLLFFTGKSFETSADIDWIQAGLFRCNPEIENADTALMQLKTKDALDIFFYTTHCSEKTFGPVLDLTGDNGYITWSFEETVFNYADGSTEKIKVDHTSTRDKQIDAVINRISNPSEFICDLAIAGRHVLAVNGAHESSPVIPVTDGIKIKKNTGKDGYRFVCLGIDKLLKKLYRKENLPLATEYPWIKIGERFPLGDYSEFNSCKTQKTN